MTPYPLVSIIIPSYNHETYVEECLDSVLAQDYPNKEIMILNDGSKDSTSTVIKNWIEKNGDKISVTFTERENRGIPKTLNELIGFARGQYLVLIASDDRLTPQSITARYEYLKNNPSKLAVVGDCKIINEDGHILHHSAVEEVHKVSKEAYQNDKSLKKLIINFKLLSGPALMVKKSVYTEIGEYDETLRSEDYDSFLKMTAKNLLGFVNVAVGEYRIHSKNHENTKSIINYAQDCEKVLLKNMKNFGIADKFDLFKMFLHFKKLKYKSMVKFYIKERIK
jgi:glycosyltransferase involved in cell wall biosynthesis